MAYVGSLAALLAQSFFRLDHYTGQVVRSFTFETYAELASRSNLDIVLRTAGMAAAVTVAAAILAFPLAYYMTFHASGRCARLLYLAVILPLWSSYLVRVYAWKLILAKEGIVSWVVAHTGLAGLLDELALPAARRRAVAFDLDHRDVPRLSLRLAALHGAADPGGARARAALAARGFGRPRRNARARLSSMSRCRSFSPVSSPGRSSPSR